MPIIAAQHLAGADAAQRPELAQDAMIGGFDRRRRSARSRWAALLDERHQLD